MRDQTDWRSFLTKTKKFGKLEPNSKQKKQTRTVEIRFERALTLKTRQVLRKWSKINKRIRQEIANPRIFALQGKKKTICQTLAFSFKLMAYFDK